MSSINDKYPRLTQKRLLRLQVHLSNELLQTGQDGENDDDGRYHVYPKKTLCDFRVEELFINGDDKYVIQNDTTTLKKSTEGDDYVQRAREVDILQGKEQKDSYDLNNSSMNISADDITLQVTKRYNESESVLKIDQSLFQKVSIHVHEGPKNAISRIFDPNNTSLLYSDNSKFIFLKKKQFTADKKSPTYDRLLEEVNKKSPLSSGTSTKPEIKDSKDEKSKEGNYGFSKKGLQLKGKICTTGVISKRLMIRKKRSSKTSFNLKFPNLNL